MKAHRRLIRLGCMALLAAGSSAAIPTLSSSAVLLAQSPSGPSGSVELEETLFVQAPERAFAGHPIVVVWLPQPLEKLCLGKTMSQCAMIDFCIRTTNPDSAQCKNVRANLARIPKYPPNMLPPRMESVTLSYLSPDRFPELQSFYKSAPQESLQRLSMSARVKARIRFTPSPNFDSVQVLDVVAVAPF